MFGKLKKYIWLLFPLVLSSLLFLLVFMQSGVFPAGNKVAFYWDGFDQCYPFLQALRKTLLNGNELKYSMQSALGMDNIGLVAYYLSSPINLITLFFPAKWMTEAYLLIILIKTGLGAAAFALFAYLQLKASCFTAVLFSLPYGLMGWAINYSYFIIWLDGLIWLPLICLAIHYLINKNSSIPLTACYAAMFLSNYYIGFIVGLFSVLYFLYCAAINITKPTIKKWAFKGFYIFVTGIMAFGMVSWLILPSFLLMRSNMDVINQALPKLSFNFIEVLRSFLNSGVLSDYFGLKLFSSIFAFILALSFLFNKNYTLRKRIITAFFILIMLLSMQINLLNLIWHLMDEPTGFPYRQSFSNYFKSDFNCSMGCPFVFND